MTEKKEKGSNILAFDRLSEESTVSQKGGFFSSIFLKDKFLGDSIYTSIKQYCVKLVHSFQSAYHL